MNLEEIKSKKNRTFEYNAFLRYAIKKECGE